MAEEFIQKNYYNSSNKKFIDTHLSECISIEWFLSKLLFHDDLSRVVYATPDIAFRKRVELLDEGKNGDGIIKPVSLQLPFASYYQSSDPEPDDRMAAVGAGQVVQGIYYPDINRTMRALAVKTHYKITIAFARRDDVRVAQQLLMWEQEPKNPIKMYNYVTWRGQRITIPTFAHIESINTNPEYKETDWLKQNRIFLIEVDMFIRSYQLLINNVDKIIQLPIRFRNFIDDYEEGDDEPEFYCEEIALEWASEKFNLNVNTDDVDTRSESYIEATNKQWFNSAADAVQQHNSVYQLPNDYSTNIMASYFDTPIPSKLEKYMYVPEKSSEHTACIEYAFDEDTLDQFAFITFHIPTKKDIVVTNKNQTEVVFEDLYPNSEYLCTITVGCLDGSKNIFNLAFVTADTPTNLAPQPNDINRAVAADAEITDLVNGNIDVDAVVKEVETEISKAEEEASKEPAQRFRKSQGLVGMTFY